MPLRKRQALGKLSTWLCYLAPIEALLFLAENKSHHTKGDCTICTKVAPVDVILERVETFEDDDG